MSHRFRTATVNMTDSFLPTVVATIAVFVADASSVASIQISNATATSAVQTMTVFEILPIATTEPAVVVVQVRRRDTSRQRSGCRPGDNGPFANRYIGCCYHVGILVAMNATGDYR